VPVVAFDQVGSEAVEAAAPGVLTAFACERPEHFGRLRSRDVLVLGGDDGVAADLERKGDSIESYKTCIASPFDWPEPAEQAERRKSALLATLGNKKPDVSEKYQNTAAILSRHLEEYRALYAKTAVPPW
jgi:hypothetical protein